ncbi:MAG: PAS domain S-box-containing protein [Glaciecola sp.]|jgi:PAS domain S-box-containing protein
MINNSAKALQEVLDHQEEMIVRFNAKGIMTYVNDSYCKIYQDKAQDLLGNHINKFITKEEVGMTWEVLSTLTIDNPILSGVREFVNPDGSPGYHEWVTKAVFNSKSEVTDYQSVGRDVTERMDKENKLSESKENLILGLQFAGAGEFNCLVEDNVFNFSLEVLNILGVQPSGFGGDFEAYLDFIPGEGRAVVRALIFDYIQNPRPGVFEYEHQFIKRDTGEKRWLMVRCKSRMGKDGKPESFAGICIDITSRKKEQEDIEKQKENLSLGLGAAKIGEFEWAINSNTTLFSDMIYEIFGVPKGDMDHTLEGFVSLIPVDGRDRVRDIIFYHMENQIKDMLVFDNQILRPSGELIWIENRCHLTFDDNGGPLRFSGVIIDVTKKKIEEVKLAESRKNLSLAMESAKVGEFEFFIKDSYTKWTDEIYTMFSIDKATHEPILENYLNYIPEYDRQRIALLIQDYIENPDGQIFLYEHEMDLPDGRKIWVQVRADLHCHSDGSPHYFSGIAIDVTEKKLAELQLKNAFDEVNKLKKQLERENTYLKEEIAFTYNYENLIYGSAQFGEVLSEVERVAPTDATVLISGETGTGKELIARAIHNTGFRKDKPLIKVNCAAIPRELIESELFGHEKGSFTGAIKNKLGKFELADGGTIFLDEIGEMPLDLQPKLLRALQEGEIERVGSEKTLKVDVRVIAATNRVLKKESDEGNFRKDLYFRLNVFPIKIPPLRDRVEDIPILVDYFVKKYSKKYGKVIKFIPDSTLAKMKDYEWQGNVRELENSVERAIIQASGDVLNFIGFEGADGAGKSKKVRAIDNMKSLSLGDVQKDHIMRLLKECEWKIGGKNGAAEKLDLKPSTLRDKMKKFNLVRPV